MKQLKITAAAMSAVLLSAALFSSCAGKGSAGNETQTEIQNEITTVSSVENADEISVCVAYFSLGNETDGIKTAAESIARKTGAELFEITTPLDYTDGTDALRREIEEDIHPVINERIKGLSSTGALFLGFPCVDGALPMEIVSFMEEYDLRDVVLLPFTDGGCDNFDKITQKLDAVSFGSSQSVLLDLSENENTDGLISGWLDSLGFSQDAQTQTAAEE